MAARIRIRFLVTTAMASMAAAGSPAVGQDYGYVNGDTGAQSLVNPNGTTIAGARTGVFVNVGGFALTNEGGIRGNGNFDSPTALPDAGVLLGGTTASTVVNSGVISGAGLGITTIAFFDPSTGLLSPGPIGTSVTNSGTITGESNDGVRLVGGGAITNSGQISGLVGSGADGVSMFAYGGQNTQGQASIGSVTNRAGGAISGARFGVILTGGGMVGNAGTLTGGNAAVYIQAQSSEAGKTAVLGNSGTLSGNRGAAVGGSLVSAEFTNSGTITGTGSHGVMNESAGRLAVRNLLGGQIVGATSGIFGNSGVVVENAGTIRGNGSYDGFNATPDSGVTLAGAGSRVDNSGTISGAGAGISTIYLYDAATDTLQGLAVGTTVTNSGTITGESNDGVRLIGGGSVTNSGTIQGVAGAGTDGVSMYAFDGQDTAGQTGIGQVLNQGGGTISGARFGVILTGGGTVTNAGTINGGTTAGAGSGNAAVLIQAVSTEAGKAGTLVNSGVLSGWRGAAAGGSLASAEFINSGTVTGTGAAGVANDSAGLLTLRNEAGGTITGATSGVFGNGSALAVVNAGTILGNGTYDGFDRAPDGGVALSGPASSIVNSGTIRGAGAGITTLHHVAPGTSDLQPLAIGTVVTNTGEITGETNDGVRLIGGGTVTNAGLIRGVAGAGADGVSMFRLTGQDTSGQTSIGTVTNQAGGTVSGARFGVILSGGGTITNDGAIGGVSGAVFVQPFDPADAGKIGTVVNRGTMSSSGTALTFGGGLASASVFNSGAIASTTAHGVRNGSTGMMTLANAQGGEIRGLIGVWGDAGVLSLDNAGTIRGDGTAAGPSQVPTHGGVVVAQAGSMIVNSGTISGYRYGVATTPHLNAATGALEALASNTIVQNSGVIIGDSNDAVFLVGGGGVTNSGVIRGVAGALTDGIQMQRTATQALSATDNVGSVANAAGGLIEGQRWGVALIGGGDVTNAGTITGAQVASAQSGGILIATGNGQSGKSATVANSGTINGLVELTTAQNLLVNSGTINGAANVGTGAEAVVGASVLVNSGTINGAVTFGAGDDRYDFIAGARQNGIVDGGAGTDTLRLLFGNVSQPQQVDGSLFVNFEQLVQDHQGTISLFFSGAQTFTDFGADNGGSIDLQNGTVQSLSVGTGSSAALGSQVVVDAAGDGATAVAVTGSSGTVTSSATIQAAGNAATAVALTGAGSSFANSGTITASGDSATAVSLGGAGAALSSAPGATIGTTGSNSTAVALTGDASAVSNAAGATITTQGDNSVGVAVASTGSTLQNDGTLVTAGANSDAVSVLGNDATINNTSNNTIRTTGANSDGVQIAGTGNVIRNIGTIRVADATSVAINVVAGAGAGNAVNNLAGGSIIAAGDAILGGAGDETVTNAGSITGNVRLGGGNDTLVLVATGTVGGTIDGGAGIDSLTQQVAAAGAEIVAASGFESYTKTGAGTLTVSRTSNPFGLATIAEGRLRLADGTLTANTSLAAGARLTGNGRIAGNLAVRGILAPGNSIGTINVAGDLSFAAGSTYEVETNADGRSDRIVATGAAALGGTVSVLPEPGSYAKVTSYQILSAGSVSGRFAGVTSGAASLVPYLSYGATGVTLTLARSDLSFGGIASTPTQASVASAVQARGRGDAIHDAVILRPTADEGRAALDALSGSFYPSIGTVLLDESRTVRSALLERAGLAPADGYGVWAAAFGGWADAQRSNTVAGLSSERRGVMAGFEGATSGGLRLGVGAGYSGSDIRRGSDTGDVGTKLIGLFAGWTGGRFSARLGGSYAWHDIDVRRSASIGTFTSASTARTDGETGQIAAEFGYALIEGPVNVQPFVGLAHVRAKVDSLREVGGAAALDVAHRTQNATVATGGLHLDGAATLSTKVTLMPRLSVAYSRNWGDIDSEATAQFVGGTSFVVAGSRLGRDSVVMEGGLDLAIGGSLTIGAGFEASVSKAWIEKAGTLSLGLRF